MEPIRKIEGGRETKRTIERDREIERESIFEERENLKRDRERT